MESYHLYLKLKTSLKGIHLSSQIPSLQYIRHHLDTPVQAGNIISSLFIFIPISVLLSIPFTLSIEGIPHLPYHSYLSPWMVPCCLHSSGQIIKPNNIPSILVSFISTLFLVSILRNYSSDTGFQTSESCSHHFPKAWNALVHFSKD